MKKLYFIRHGLSLSNLEGKLNGAEDSPLSDLGREQAKAAGKKAKTLAIDTVVTSPFQRTHDTAKIVSEIIGYPVDKIYVSELFSERDFGPFEGAKYPVKQSMDGVAGVEPVEDILDRAEKSLKYLRQLKGNNILVVSHGSFGRALRYHTLNYSYSHPEQFRNAEIVRLI